MHAVARRSEMSDPDDAYLGAQARAYLESGSAVVTLVELAGEPHPIAAALVYDDGTRRYYAHAAADDAHRRLSPGVVLVSNIIERAAAAGRQEFDLYGVVPPEVTDHAWSGFSKFKRAFGGYQVDYSGTWEIGVRPLRYAAYRLARRLRG